MSAESQLRKLFLHLYDKHPSKATRDDLDARKIVVTPFDGAYGQAGSVVALNGSPPRGVIVTLETDDHRSYPPPIFYLTRDSSRRLGEAQCEVVRQFILEHAASIDRNSAADADAGEASKSPRIDAATFSPGPWIFCGDHVDNARGIPILRATQSFDAFNPLDVKLASLAPQLLRQCEVFVSYYAAGKTHQFVNETRELIDKARNRKG